MGRWMVVLGLVLAGLAPSSAAALAPVGPNVVGLWQGEGDAVDPFGGHDGALVGGAAFAPFATGQGFSFTAAQQAVDIPDAAELYPSGSFTVAGWIRTSQATGDQALIEHYECGGSCPTNQALSVFLLAVSAGKANAYVRDADGGGPVGSGQELTGATNIADGAPHHLAFVRDVPGAELKLYVDGVVVASAALDPGAAGALLSLDGEADDLYLGAVRRCLLPQPDPCDGLLVNQVSGELDDDVYWSRAVSDAEIAAIHAAGPNGLTTDVTAPESSASAPASVPAGGTVAVAVTATDPAGPAPRVHDPSTPAHVDLYAKGPGDAALAKVATAPGAAAAGFTYAPAGGPGTYAFATRATDVAGNAEAPPSAPDAVTVVGSPAPAPPNVTPVVAATPVVVPVQSIASGLPPAPKGRACLSRRAFTITLRDQPGVKLTGAVVTLRGKRLKVVRRAGRLTSAVDLRGLRAGRYTLQITATLADGRRITGSRTYRTCAPRARR